MTPAIVMGLSPTGLHVVRALGEAGVPVYGVGQGLQAGSASRYMVSSFSEPDEAKRLEKLIALAAKLSKRPVLIPTSDQEIDFVMKHSQQLAQSFEFQDSYLSGLAGDIMDKDRFYDLCQTHGVRVPQQLTSEPDGLHTLRDAVAMPCMIKPARIHQVKHLMKGEKGWIARSLADFDKLCETIPSEAGTLLVQEIIPGPESEITLFCTHAARDGQFHHSYTARKLRQFPPGFGSASLVQTHPEPESAAIAERFLAAVNYHGIAAAEFKRHADTGELCIIEINVRTSLWFSISHASGRPVVLSSYRELAGLPPESEQAQENGVRWRYTLKDAYSARFYRKSPDFVLPPPDIAVVGSAKRTIGAVFQANDPGPALAELLNFARKAWGRIARKVRRG